MTVFDLMTGGDEEQHINQEPTLERKPTMRKEVAMENVKDKNPHCQFYGSILDQQSLVTPLHLAAAEGHLKVYKLIFQNVKDSLCSSK